MRDSKISLCTSRNYHQIMQTATVRKHTSPFQLNKQNHGPVHNAKPDYQDLWTSKFAKCFNTDVQQLTIVNERLARQNQMLHIELKEKQNLIKKLKQQLDDFVLQETKFKLEHTRYIQQQVERQLIEWKKQFQQRISYENQQKDKLRSELAKLNDELAHVTQQASIQRHQSKCYIQALQMQSHRDNDRHALELEMLECNHSKLVSESNLLKQSLLKVIDEKESIIKDLQKVLLETIEQSRRKHAQKVEDENSVGRADETFRSRDRPKSQIRRNR